MHPQFLLIDDNRDGRSVIARAMQRKYPDAPLRAFASFPAAAGALAEVPADPHNWIVVIGRTPASGTVELAGTVRAAHARVPLIALGRKEDARAALAAGATHFLEYEAWLLLGVMVERVMAEWPKTPPARPPGEPGR